jgi:hypothetical protein
VRSQLLADFPFAVNSLNFQATAQNRSTTTANRMRALSELSRIIAPGTMPFVKDGEINLDLVQATARHNLARVD